MGFLVFGWEDHAAIGIRKGFLDGVGAQFGCEVFQAKKFLRNQQTQGSREDTVSWVRVNPAICSCR